MKPITLIIASLFATAAFALADGIPLNRKTGEVTVAHTIVSLTPEQVQETQSLGTFTLTPEQWREIRAKSPTCPKRFENIFTTEFNECCCECGPYVIALAPDRFAVLTSDNSGVSPDFVRQELFKSPSYLHADERGQFYVAQQLVPFDTLLKALISKEEYAKLPNYSDRGQLIRPLPTKDDENKERWLNVELPAGAKVTDAVYESHLRQIAAAADKAGLRHRLFRKADGESGN